MTRYAEPTVAVVICASTEDRWNEMMASVGSVMQQTHHAAEIILVIDHNPVLLRRAAFELPGVLVIPNNNEKGLSGARNSGLAAASSEVVAFLGEDSFAALNWLDILVAPYKNPDVLGVAGRIIPLWRTGRPGWLPPEFDWVVGCSYRGMPAERTPVRNLTSASISLRRELLLKRGGFDSSVGRIRSRSLQREQTELSVHAQCLDPLGVFLYEPAAVIRQGIPGSQYTWPYFRSRCFTEGLSKSLAGRAMCAGPGSVTEEVYVRSVIPKAIATSTATALRGDLMAAYAALAMSAGLALIGAGYARGLVERVARYGLAKRRPGCRRSRNSAGVSVTEFRHRRASGVGLQGGFGVVYWHGSAGKFPGSVAGSVHQDLMAGADQPVEQ